MFGRQRFAFLTSIDGRSYPDADTSEGLGLIVEALEADEAVIGLRLGPGWAAFATASLRRGWDRERAIRARPRQKAATEGDF